nr:hypothetical protein [Polymorphobacter sp.]
MPAATDFRDYAAGASAIVAALAFLSTIFAKYFENRRDREVSARAAWEKYLEMAFENPALARAVDVESDADQYERYEWFVSRMLYAAEEVLLLAPTDPYWDSAIKSQVGYHSEYLSGVGEKYCKHYSARLQKLIKVGLSAHA